MEQNSFHLIEQASGMSKITLSVIVYAPCPSKTIIKTKKKRMNSSADTFFWMTRYKPKNTSSKDRSITRPRQERGAFQRDSSEIGGTSRRETGMIQRRLFQIWTDFTKGGEKCLHIEKISFARVTRGATTTTTATTTTSSPFFFFLLYWFLLQ